MPLVELFLAQPFLTPLTPTHRGYKQFRKYLKEIDIMFLLDIFFLIDKFDIFIIKDTDI